MSARPKAIHVFAARKCRRIRAKSSSTLGKASGVCVVSPRACAKPPSHTRESLLHRNIRRDAMTLTSTHATKPHARVSRRTFSTCVQHIQSNASIDRTQSPMIAAASRGNAASSRGNAASTLETTNAWARIEVYVSGSRSSTTASRHRAPHQHSMSSAPITLSRDSARLHANFESKTVSVESRAATPHLVRPNPEPSSRNIDSW
jgi:hypothetical protein